ncbi:MAG: enoyl-CoA hydratase, partial [Caulobacter sp.]
MSLILTEKRGHIAILTLNRPDAMNALGAPGDGDQVAAACEAINDDQDI